MAAQVTIKTNRGIDKTMRMEVVPVVGDNVIWSHQAQKYQGRVSDRTLDYAGFDENVTIVIDDARPLFEVPGGK